MLAWALLTVVSLAVLLAFEALDRPAGRWVAKPLASTGFLGVALAGGALDTGYGLAVLAALALSWLGDVLLIPDSRSAFLAGLTAFLLGHLGFALAFLVRGVDPAGTVGAVVVLVAPALAVRAWLQPHVPEPMRGPVLGYVVAISLMVATAVGAFVAGAPPTLLVGALAFYVSDLAVARNQFVSPTAWNRSWGLPLYYAGQLLLAATVVQPDR